MRIIAITGTRKGIGKELAEYFLARGLAVVGCSRDAGSIVHANYSHYQLDVNDETAVAAMFKGIEKSHARLDYLLNNAGIASMNHLLLTPTAVGRRIFDTNFFGTFIMLRQAARLMVKRNFGRIVNFTTVATPLRLEGEAMYAASKAAVESLTEIAARELSPFGITVNAVGPTPVPTDLIRSVPKEKMTQLLARQAIRRFGTVEDVQNVVDFFLADKSGFVTGQTIYLGGVNA